MAIKTDSTTCNLIGSGSIQDKIPYLFRRQLVQFQEEGLEKRLADAEEAANALLKTAEAAILSIKAYRRAAQQGDLREMHKAMEAVEENATALKQQSITAKELWNLNEEEYLSSPAFRSELIELAKQESLDIFQQDG